MGLQTTTAECYVLLFNTIVMLMMILLLVLPQGITYHHADTATTLPVTILSGVYVSADEAIPVGGTTLNVQSMLNDASANGLQAAVFETTRMAGEGNLTITLPATAAAWTTTTNIPLHVLIIDGTSSATVLLPIYISVTGVLALGSSITLQGGTYNFQYRFVNFPSGMSIQDGAALTIQGGTYRLQFSAAVLYTAVVYIQQGVTLSNNGTLTVSDNIVSVSDTTVSGASAWMWTMLFFNQDIVSIQHLSTLFMANNSMAVFNITGGSTYWQWTLLYSTSDTNFNVKNSSAVDIHGNTFEGTNIAMTVISASNTHSFFPFGYHRSAVYFIKHHCNLVQYYNHVEHRRRELDGVCTSIVCSRNSHRCWKYYVGVAQHRGDGGRKYVQHASNRHSIWWWRLDDNLRQQHLRHLQKQYLTLQRTGVGGIHLQPVTFCYVH